MLVRVQPKSAAPVQLCWSLTIKQYSTVLLYTDIYVQYVENVVSRTVFHHLCISHQFHATS